MSFHYLTRTAYDRDYPAFNYLPGTVFLILGFICQLALILWMNNGKFTFVLDDPYIHLALSENLLSGHFGVNAEEFSAPSSSIVWPLLLAPLSMLDFSPVIFTFISALFGVFAVTRLLNKVFINPPNIWEQIGLQLMFLVLGNWLGLIFTGLENALQAALSLWILVGILELTTYKTPPAWWMICVIAMPFVRYEGLIWVVMACGSLVIYRYYRHAAKIAICVVVGLVGFSIFLSSLDLSALPSSVVAKSASSSLLKPIITFYNNLYSNEGTIMLLLCAPLLVFAAKPKLIDYNPELDVSSMSIANLRWVGVMLFLGICGHLAMARVGNWGRYEIYLLLPLILFAMIISRRWLQFLLDQAPKVALVIGCLLVIVIGKRYMVTSLLNPVGANNIYEQQYQMHRFVTEFYQKPVGVNDLGWVSYQNDHYVLDYWGLASLEAQQLRSQSHSANWMQQLNDKHQVGLAMIYYDPDWFAEVPNSWQLIGWLYLSPEHKRMTSNKRRVAFFATSPEYVGDIKASLAKFEASLPNSTYFRYQ